MDKAPVSDVDVTSFSPCGKDTAQNIHRNVSDNNNSTYITKYNETDLFLYLLQKNRLATP